MGQFFKQVMLEKHIRHKNRFFLSPKVLEYFNSIVAAASKHFTTTQEEGSLIYRARRHSVLPPDTQVPYIYEYKPATHPADQMGAPPSHLATAGRLNPAGIPYLYAASDKLTAIAEIRPWVGAYLTTATLRLARTARMIDMRLRETSASEVVSDGKEFAKFWNLWQRTICSSFSIPHHPEDNTAYTPTQYVSAAFHHAGFDGIVYSSSLNWGGFNLAFFDPKIAVVQQVEIQRITSVKYEVTTV